jgi:hypothetical protein
MMSEKELHTHCSSPPPTSSLAYSHNCSVWEYHPNRHQPLHHCDKHHLTMCCLCSYSTTTQSTTVTSTRTDHSLSDEQLYYSHVVDHDDDDRSESDCQWNKHNNRSSSSLMTQHDSKNSLLDEMDVQEDIDVLRNQDKSYLHRLHQSITSVLTRVSLVRLSICILACATLFDMVITNMHNTTMIDRPTRVSLGSAAISSVTDTLSPILPFAGGLDLRRDDYWLVSDDSTWFKTLQSVITQVQDAFAAKEEAAHTSKLSSNNHKSKESITRSTKNTKPSPTRSSYEMAISVSQPFVSLDVIAQLTLGDIGECFRYVMESSNMDFSEAKFYNSQASSITQPYLRQVIQGIQSAVDRSRGKKVIDWSRTNDNSSSEINSKTIAVDALKFSAAMRVFAEWRLLRQVPDGYKGFAIGMSLGHKDVVQNIIKIEESAHNYIDYHRTTCLQQQQESQMDNHDLCNKLQTPTLRDLLSYEIETGVHPTQRLPFLKEKSAGMGLLWVRRQLAYQTQIFDNILNMKGSSMKDAVGAAYKQVYDQYHGWAVQKIFSYSFQAAPEAEEILRHMNPRRLQELIQEQQRLMATKQVYYNDTNTVASDHDHNNPIGQFVHHIGGEWDKLAYNVVKIFNNDVPPPLSILQEQQKESSGVAIHEANIDQEFITREMVQDAHIQIKMYLQRIQPILQSIQVLFLDLNMDDPTRV